MGGGERNLGGGGGERHHRGGGGLFFGGGGGGLFGGGGGDVSAAILIGWKATSSSSFTCMVGVGRGMPCAAAMIDADDLRSPAWAGFREARSSNADSWSVGAAAASSWRNRLCCKVEASFNGPSSAELNGFGTAAAVAFVCGGSWT